LGLNNVCVKISGAFIGSPIRDGLNLAAQDVIDEIDQIQERCRLPGGYIIDFSGDPRGVRCKKVGLHNVIYMSKVPLLLAVPSDHRPDA
jgi:hypothetical protein